MSCEQFKQGDWVVIDEWACGTVGYIHNPTLIDVWLHGDESQDVLRVRTDHHKLTKITKEVADIMKGV